MVIQLFCSHQIRRHDFCADHRKDDDAIAIGSNRGRTKDRLAQMIVPFALETPPYPCPHGRMLQNAYLISNDANKCESSIISFKEMVKFCHFLARPQRCAAETPVLSEMSAGIRKRSEENTSEFQ